MFGLVPFRCFLGWELANLGLGSRIGHYCCSLLDPGNLFKVNKISFRHSKKKYYTRPQKWTCSELFKIG